MSLARILRAVKIDRPDEDARVEMMHLSVNERGGERLRIEGGGGFCYG